MRALAMVLALAVAPAAACDNGDVTWTLTVYVTKHGLTETTALDSGFATPPECVAAARARGPISSTDAAGAKYRLRCVREAKEQK
jgi:hypothetical protein